MHATNFVESHVATCTKGRWARLTLAGSRSEHPLTWSAKRCTNCITFYNAHLICKLGGYTFNLVITLHLISPDRN